MNYAYINAILLDGTEEMTPKTDLVVRTNGENIVDIVPKGTDLTGYTIVNLEGKYLMPGLINLHVHLPASGRPQKKQRDNTKLVKFVTGSALTRSILQAVCEKNAQTQLYSGVTTLRTVGGVMNYDTKIRDRILSGQITGPRILASNMAVSVPGGHMAGSVAYEAHSEKEAVNYVRRIAQDQPDLIKLMITGGVLDAKIKGEPGELKMPAEYVKAACKEAHRLGLKVAAHVESPQGVLVALENGVDSIEHGANPDDRIMELFKERGACHVTTLSPALPYALFDRSISHASETEQFNGQVVFDGIVNCAKACLAEGIPVGLGTDTGCPYITHYDMWRELVYFHKFCDVSTAYALHCATLGNAKILGLENTIGSIAPGKCADFIVTNSNPLENLETLRSLYMVVARGQIIEKPKIKKMPQVERELDKFL